MHLVVSSLNGLSVLSRLLRLHEKAEADICLSAIALHEAALLLARHLRLIKTHLNFVYYSVCPFA